MAAWLNHIETRDPVIYLMEKERRQCKGCIHLDFLWQQKWCLKKQKPAEQKCSLYKEAE